IDATPASARSWPLVPAPSSVTGMLRALPPERRPRSSTSTRQPRSIISCAALMPATPPPRTITFVGMRHLHEDPRKREQGSFSRGRHWFLLGFLFALYLGSWFCWRRLILPVPVPVRLVLTPQTLSSL